MEKLINEMLEIKKWAVVGATKNQNKYGNKIYKLLKEKNYDVIGVNPIHKDIEGDLTKPDLLSIEKEINCISVVVGPEKAVKVVEEAIKKGIKYMWFQPGTFTPEIIEKAENAGINVVFHNCILVEIGKRDTINGIY
ncbi:MAG: CoA-binding protein [Bacillota bacterium]|nr:CoA-binding protein [Bacillota bacterium]